MRFNDWDILLFPEDSRVPMQEFEVKCQALPQSHAPSSRLLALAGDKHENSVTLAPNLTCFISSLEPGRPFRVSIHSWEKPKPSDLLKSFKVPPKNIVFEAKLYIDGHLKAQRHMNDQSTWPEVIDTVASDEFTKPLRFPPFHTEILQQSHWDASDSLGRIRLVITEGITHTDRFADLSSFDRLREVAVFSFQHAPKHILEYSSIAWPNDRMFAASSPFRWTNNFDAHAHSPRRPSDMSSDRKDAQKIAAATRMNSLHASKWNPKPAQTGEAAEDPFMGPTQTLLPHSQKIVDLDVSFHDSFASRKDASAMSGVEMERSCVDHPTRSLKDDLVKDTAQAPRTTLFDAYFRAKHEEAGNSAISVSRSGASYKGCLKKISNSERPTLSSLARTSRQASVDSQRSNSAQSGRMSWEEAPTLVDLWSTTRSEHSGLLPNLQSSASSKERSISMASKRKRIGSPPYQQPTSAELSLDTKGMSTSPLKPTSTPSQNAAENECTVIASSGK